MKLVGSEKIMSPENQEVSPVEKKLADTSRSTHEKADPRFDYFVDNAAWVLVFSLIVWAILGFAAPLLITWMLGSLVPKFDRAGQFGDMFGAANSLFSAFAFVAAIFAVMLQTQEMKESGERRLEEEKQQTEQMRIAKQTLDIQTAMREDDRQERFRECLRSANHAATKCLANTPSGDVSVFSHRMSEPERAEFYRQGREARQRHRMSRLELGDIIGQLTMLFSDQGNRLTNVLKEIVIATKEHQPEESEQQRLLDLVWVEVQSLWNQVKEGSASESAQKTGTTSSV